jgi:ankyrin repeat protein
MELLKFLQENDLEGFKENLDMDSIEEIDEEKNTILHHCVEKGAYDFVDTLVYNGADPNVKNKYGETPVHIAARNDFDKIMELLLEFGGDVTIKNNHQRSALNLATTLKSKKVLRVIENSGMDYSATIGREKITHHRRFEEEY